MGLSADRIKLVSVTVVIINREDWDEWLASIGLGEEMSVLAVSPLVNSARIDDAWCIDPLMPSLRL